MEFLVNTSAGRAFTMGFIIMLLISPYWLCRGVKEFIEGRKIKSSEAWVCMIPFYNKIVTDKLYFGHLSLGLGSIIGVVLMIIRVITAFITQNTTVYHITAILMLVGFAVWYICNMIYSAIVIKESGYMKWFGAILWSIIYPIGFYYYANVVVKELNLDAKKGLH